jgi:Xaa-Pro aminopeptidase
MKPPPTGLPVEEYQGRTERAQTLMAAQGLDALLFTSEPDVRYFTGFLTRFWESTTRPWFLIVPAAGKPIAVIPTIGAELMSHTWLEDIRTWSAPCPQDDGVSLLVETLFEIAGKNGQIGVPKGPETTLRMPLGDFARLRDATALKFNDATEIVRTLCLSKSKAEIAKIAHICAVAGRAFDDMAAIAGEGVPLKDVFRDFQVLLLQAGADWVAYLAGGAGPGGYNDVISCPTDQSLRRGDVMMLDTGAVYDGYFCDFDCNYAIKHADNDARRAYHTLFAATEAGLDVAKPGTTCADLYQAMYAVIASEFGTDAQAGRMGHGLGMRLTEWPSLSPGDYTVLQPGMVLTLEPSLQISPGRIMVHEENIAIGADSVQLLTRRAPPDLPLL